jgi:hypothetical protein
MIHRVLMAALSAAILVSGCSKPRTNIHALTLEDGTSPTDAGWRFETLGGWDFAFDLQRSTDEPNKAELQAIVVDPMQKEPDPSDRVRDLFAANYEASLGIGPVPVESMSDSKHIEYLRSSRRMGVVDADEPQATARIRSGDWFLIHAEANTIDNGSLVVNLQFEVVRDGRPIEGRSRIGYHVVFDNSGAIASWIPQQDD